MRNIAVIAHDIRSIHNIGSLMRTCEGMGVDTLYITGYSPYPKTLDDTRLPHISEKIQKSLDKTALGSDKMLTWKHYDSITKLITNLKGKGYVLCGLEQTSNAIQLPDYIPPSKVALLLGREVEGIDDELIALCDETIVIPMFGKKESFNVVQAAAIALYHIRFA